MKKIYALILTFILVLGILCSCASGGVEYKPSDSISWVDKTNSNISGSVSEVDSVSSEEVSQKIIKKMSIRAETLNYNSDILSLKALVSQYNGYFTESTEYSYNNSNGSAEFQIRVPAESLEEFASKLGDIFNIRSSTLSTEEVTQQYYDYKAQYDSLLVQEAKLEQLLTEATNLTEYFQIDDKLTSVRAKINYVSSQLQYLEKSTSMSYVSLYITEVHQYVESENPTFLQQVGEAFVNMFYGCGDVLQWLVIAFIYMLPIIAIAVVVTIIIVHSIKKKNAKKKEPESNEQK